MGKQLSEHFNSDEFRCHCCGELHPDGVPQELVDGLEEIRASDPEGPVNVMSGYRCPKHNAAVGGAKGSLHMAGKAADIHKGGTTPADVADIASDINVFADGGIGRYATFTHVDVRGHKSRWNG